MDEIECINNKRERGKSMKNYLFAPFNDDDEKIEEFNHIKNYLPSGHRNSLIMFIGRLESYYDNIISGLRSDNAVAVADEIVINKLEDEITELKAEESESMGWIEQYKKGCEDYREEIAELRAVNDGLIDVNKQLLMKIEGLKSSDDVRKLRISRLKNDELQAEIKQLRADMAHDSEVCYDLDDKHADIIKRLEEEVKESKEQYHMLASSKTSHYPKEYHKEADEYFHHNPQSKGIRFHMIDFNDYDYDDNDGLNGLSGEYNGLLLAEDCIAEIDN